MKNKNNNNEDIEKMAPFLSKIEKENHFSVPENYFEVLPEVISDKNLNMNFLQTLIDRLSWRVLVPVSSLIVLFLFFFNFNQNNTKFELSSEQLSELIIEEDYLDIDDYLIYDAYAEILEDENEESSDTEEYINYLIENNIDINTIIEEL
jgi:hypothetical protein